MKIHYIKRRLGTNLLTNKQCYFYDFYSACGVGTIISSNHMRKYVTCKNCKRTELFKNTKG